MRPFSVCQLEYSFLEFDHFQYLYEVMEGLGKNLDYLYVSPTLTTASVSGDNVGIFLGACSEVLSQYKTSFANPPKSELPNWFRNSQNKNNQNYCRFLASLNGLVLPETSRSSWKLILENKELKITLNSPLLEKGIFFQKGEEHIADFDQIRIGV